MQVTGPKKTNTIIELNEAEAEVLEWMLVRLINYHQLLYNEESMAHAILEALDVITIEGMYTEKGKKYGHAWEKIMAMKKTQ